MNAIVFTFFLGGSHRGVKGGNSIQKVLRTKESEIKCIPDDCKVNISYLAQCFGLALGARRFACTFCREGPLTDLRVELLVHVAAEVGRRFV